MSERNLPAFRRWYEKAGVRRTPRRVLDPEDPIHDYRFFPPHLVSYLNHPIVADAPELTRYLEAQYLYDWLRFVAHFEVRVVNRATMAIATGRSGVDVPPMAQQTAFQIYVDEGYHSLYSLDVVRQLEERSDIDALPYDFEAYMANLDGIANAYPGYVNLVQLLQVVIFETLVAGILLDVPDDTSVLPIVRDIARDHAEDEVTHNAYFSAFFKRIWGQLSPTDKSMVAKMLPSLITKTLHPSTRSAANALLSAGVGSSSVQTIIADCYSPHQVISGIRDASADTMKLFRGMGILDDPEMREGFVTAGLLNADEH